MNKLLLWVVMLLCGVLSYAQAPQGMSFQAVARDANGNALSEKTVAIKVEVLQGSTSGTVVYGETHRSATAKNGVVNLQIGQGTATDGTFAGIDWSRSPYFLRISMDTNGGTSYKEVATSQMLSVPYALYAEKAGSVKEEVPDFLVMPMDGPSADFLTGLGTQIGYMGFSFYITYLDGKDQAVDYEVKGLPSGVHINNEYITEPGPLGRYLRIELSIDGTVTPGTYPCTLVLKNKYGVTKTYPFTYTKEVDPYINEIEILNSLKQVMLSGYQEFSNLNKALDNAFMKQSTDEKYTEFMNKTYTPTSEVIAAYYSSAYKAIRGANDMINRVETNLIYDYDLEQPLVKQAKAIRAYTHLMLTEWFGAVPLVTKVLSMDEASTISRTPRSEVLASVIQDLRDASIQTKSASTKAEVTGLTIDEMHILLREAYLLKGEWLNAKTLGGMDQPDVNMLKSTTLVDFIKKIADWKLSNTEGITEASLMEEYMNSFHSTYGRGNLYLNVLDYSATYFTMDTYKALLPIPQKEIDLHPNYGQNTGY